MTCNRIKILMLSLPFTEQDLKHCQAEGIQNYPSYSGKKFLVVSQLNVKISFLIGQVCSQLNPAAWTCPFIRSKQ